MPGLFRYSIAVLLVVATALGGCRRSAPKTVSPAEALGQATCKVQRSSDRPLLVEWPAAERAMLEAAAETGVVAARYDGCELEVLSRCTLDGHYAYRPLTRKHDALRIRDEDALWAELPLGAAQLETALSREGQINVDMTVVGRLEVDPDAVGPARDAACGGATHIVSGMTVGAFAMYTGASIEGSASAGVGAFGGGLASSRDRSVLRRDGDFAACEDTATSEGVPPPQCGALLRVELTPIGADGSPTTAGDVDRENEGRKITRAADRWHTTRNVAIAGGAVTSAGALASVIVVGARTGQITDAEFDLRVESQTATDEGPLVSAAERARAQDEVERLESEIAQYKDDRSLAAQVAIGLGVGAVALFGFAYVAHRREQRLRDRARLEDVSIAPALGPEFNGVTLRGRF